MVWLISFLTVSNIALGYGLAVYIDRHFGAVVPHRKLFARVKSTMPAVAVVSAEPPAQPTVVAPEVTKSPPVAKAEATPARDGTPPATKSMPNEAVAADEPVDEEHVLAGIEEFRSQLAKMNAGAGTDGEEDTAADAAAELVGTTP